MFSALYSVVLLQLFHLCSPVFGQAFPTSLPQCKLGDTECLQTVMTTIIQTQAAGNKELGLMPIDPLYLDKISIAQSEQSAVNIRLLLRNVTLTGIKGAVVTKVIGFGEDIKTTKFEVFAKLKELAIVGNYTLNGKVLILPITGNGFANLAFENANLHIKVFPKAETRDGKDYAVIEKVKAKLTTTKFRLHFTNLFNDDKNLGKNMNMFLQQNSDEIFKELKVPIENVVANVVKSLASGPFGKFPYRELYLPQ